MEFDTHQEVIEFTTGERRNGKGLIMILGETKRPMKPQKTLMGNKISLSHDRH